MKNSTRFNVIGIRNNITSSTGDYGSASSTSGRGIAYLTGDYGSAASTGYYGIAASTGDNGSAFSAGYRGNASSTGDYGSASSTGERGIAAVTGEYSIIEIGPKSIGAATCNLLIWKVHTGAVLLIQWMHNDKIHTRTLDSKRLKLKDGSEVKIEFGKIVKEITE